MSYFILQRLVKLEQEVESKDEMRNKLELSIELEKNKAVSLQESVDKLNQTLNDTNVSIQKVYRFLRTWSP